MESKIGVKGCINIITKYSRRHLSFFSLSSCTALFCPLGGDLFSLFLWAVQSHPQIKLWWVFCCCFFKDPSDGDTQLSAWQHTECVCSGACICFYEVHVDIYSSIHPSINQWQVPTWSWHSQKKHQCILEPLCSRTRTAPAKGRENKKTATSAGAINLWQFSHWSHRAHNLRGTAYSQASSLSINLLYLPFWLLKILT